MLTAADGTAFTVGRARFSNRAEGVVQQEAKIFIKIVPGDLGAVMLAQMDTAAPWTILNTEVADAMALLSGQGEPVRLSTRLGRFDGRLERTRVGIVADEGESLSIEATVWVSPDWPGGNFVGYGGLLERIRFAIDPADNFFYFGPLQ